MSFFQLITSPPGIIVRWLSKCWKTFWHLWQVLLNSWACKISVLINENNLAFHSKNKPHTSVVMWGMTDWTDTDLISLYSVFCSRPRAWPWSIFLPFMPLIEWLCEGKDSTVAEGSAFLSGSVSGQRWTQLHLDPHSCEWSDLGQYKQPITPLNSFKTRTLRHRQPDHGTESLYVLKGTELLLKRAPKKRNSAGLLWVLAGERMTLVIEGWLGSVFSPSCWPPRWKGRYTSLAPGSLLTQGKVFVPFIEFKIL